MPRGSGDHLGLERTRPPQLTDAGHDPVEPAEVLEHVIAVEAPAVASV